jgi:hypothetical protein
LEQENLELLDPVAKEQNRLHPVRDFTKSGAAISEESTNTEKEHETPKRKRQQSPGAIHGLGKLCTGDHNATKQKTVAKS